MLDGVETRKAGDALLKLRKSLAQRLVQRAISSPRCHALIAKLLDQDIDLLRVAHGRFTLVLALIDFL